MAARAKAIAAVATNRRFCRRASRPRKEKRMIGDNGRTGGSDGSDDVGPASTFCVMWVQTKKFPTALVQRNISNPDSGGSHVSPELSKFYVAHGKNDLRCGGGRSCRVQSGRGVRHMAPPFSFSINQVRPRICGNDNFFYSRKNILNFSFHKFPHKFPDGAMRNISLSIYCIVAWSRVFSPYAILQLEDTVYHCRDMMFCRLPERTICTFF